MRSVALCWELGGGFGHLTVLRSLARLFSARGFRLYLIARDVCAAGRLFQGTAVTLLQAPFRHGPALQFQVTPTFAHILHNVGYGDLIALDALVTGWRSLFEMIRPELIVTEHSPTALLAARALEIPAIVCGPGFFCPPDESPLPNLLPWVRSAPHELYSVERRVLDHLNAILASRGNSSLERVTEIYHRGTTKLLLTFAELDHFPQRRGERYWGCWPYQSGVVPEWPAGEGTRIVAYLKPFPRIGELLMALARLKLPSLVFMPELDPARVQRLNTGTLRFCDRMLDLQAIDGKQCIGVTNANIGTMTGLLLKGIPLLSIPPFVEQMLAAKAVERIGAGITAMPTSGASYESDLRALLERSNYRRGAEGFAAKYQGIDPVRHEQAVFSEIAALI